MRKELIADGLVWCRVQDDPAAAFNGQLHYSLIGILIDLQLQQHVGALLQQRPQRLYLGRRNRAAGPRYDDDFILAGLFIYHDDGGASSDLIVIKQILLVKIQFIHGPQCYIRKSVMAHLGNHGHIGTGFMRGNALIEALAASAHLEH